MEGRGLAELFATERDGDMDPGPGIESHTVPQSSHSRKNRRFSAALYLHNVWSRHHVRTPGKRSIIRAGNSMASWVVVCDACSNKGAR